MHQGVWCSMTSGLAQHFYSVHRSEKFIYKVTIRISLICVCVCVCVIIVVQFALTDLYKLGSFLKSLEEQPCVTLTLCLYFHESKVYCVIPQRTFAKMNFLPESFMLFHCSWNLPFSLEEVIFDWLGTPKHSLAIACMCQHISQIKAK
jgi:hypothetical protein